MTEPERIDEIVQKTKAAVLEGVETLLQHQMEPFLDRTRKMVLETAEPLLEKMKRAVVDGADELVKKQMEPFLERARAMILASVEEMVKRHTEPIVMRAVEVMETHVPDYARRVGQRAVGYGMAVTLFCLAAVFLLLGGILGLQRAGVPPYATYLAGGSLAALVGLVILKVRSRTFEKAAGGPVS